MYTTQLTFDDLLRDLFKINKESFKFNSPVARVYETYTLDENNILLTLNLLGISAEDIKVSIKNSKNGVTQILQVEATTENKIINKNYSYSNEFTVGSARREVESFDWESKDGILYIILKYKKLSEVKAIERSDEKGLLSRIQEEFMKSDEVEVNDKGTINFK